MHSRTHRHDPNHRSGRNSGDTVERTEQARRNLAMVTGGFGAFFRHGHGHHGHGGHGHCGGEPPSTGQPPAPAAPGAPAAGAASGTPTKPTS
jgi:hypothetical protein